MKVEPTFNEFVSGFKVVRQEVDKEFSDMILKHLSFELELRDQEEEHTKKK